MDAFTGKWFLFRSNSKTFDLPYCTVTLLYKRYEPVTHYRKCFKWLPNIPTWTQGDRIMTDNQAIATIRKKRQITVPQGVLQDLGVDVGDILVFKKNSGRWFVSKL